MMTAFGDMQSLMAMGHGITSGLSLAKAGTMGALSLGANVTKGGSNLISGGISNMFSNNKSRLNSEQMTQVKESLDKHNSWKAQQQVKQYVNENSVKKSDTGFTTKNPYMDPFSLRYNPIRNQYMSQSGLEANSNFDRKWY